MLTNSKEDMEKETTKRLTIDIPNELHTKLKVIAATYNMTMKEILLSVIDLRIQELSISAESGKSFKELDAKYDFMNLLNKECDAR